MTGTQGTSIMPLPWELQLRSHICPCIYTLPLVFFSFPRHSQISKIATVLCFLVGKNTTAEHAGLHEAEERGRKGVKQAGLPCISTWTRLMQKTLLSFQSRKWEIFFLCRQAYVNLNGLATWVWKALVSPVTGVFGQPLTWPSLVTAPNHRWLLWNTLTCPEHKQTVKPERETELCVPHQLGHLKPKQPENELKKLKRDHNNETYLVPLYKHSDCSNASRRMETVILLIL